jgi:RNA polymerase sigma factor (sigma-70 family)
MSERIIRSVVGIMCKLYPDAERDDLYGQAWVILIEKADGYRNDMGTSFNTYLYRCIYNGLQDYLNRKVVKQWNMGGHRVHNQDAEAVQSDFFPGYEAKEYLEKILLHSTGDQRLILDLMLHGYSLPEAADILTIPRTTAYSMLKSIKDNMEDKQNG